MKFYENENKYFDAYENRYKTPQKFNNVNKERVTEFNGFDFQGTGSETTGMVDVFNDFALEGAFFKQKYMLINNITPTDRFYIPQSGIDYNPFDVLFFDGDDSTKSSGDVRDFNLIYKKGLDAKMYALNINNFVFKAEKKAVIFNYDSDLKVEGKEFEKFSAIYLENEEVKVEGKGKLIICEF